MAEVQCRLFARATGQQIAEVEPSIDEVAWRLNNVASAKLSLPYTDAQCTPDNLASGNRLLLSFDCGLPEWGGVLDYPRTRTSTGVQCTGYSGEKLLDWRVTAKGRYFSQTAPGGIFEALLDEENAEWATGLQFESAWGGGSSRTLEYHHHDLLTRIQDLTRLTGADFAITPRLSGGYVSFWASWLERRGSDKTTSVVLTEGRNLLHAQLDEQGPIANVIYTIGEGATWGTERLVGYAIDYDSVSVHGYREYAEVQGGVKHQSTLDENAAELLAELAWPRLRFTVYVTDDEPAGFADYDVGDRVTLECFLAHSAWAYSGTVRIRARAWRGGELCQLEVEEWAG